MFVSCTPAAAARLLAWRSLSLQQPERRGWGQTQGRAAKGRASCGFEGEPLLGANRTLLWATVLHRAPSTQRCPAAARCARLPAPTHPCLKAHAATVQRFTAMGTSLNHKTIALSRVQKPAKTPLLCGQNMGCLYKAAKHMFILSAG